MLPPLVVLPDRFELLDRFLPGAIDIRGGIAVAAPS
jgi:hypothetical protein